MNKKIINTSFGNSWSKQDVQAILPDLMDRGETIKVDQKSVFKLETKPQKEEFIKDISAIANSYSPDYSNYGFIIFSLDKELLKRGEDHIQASIEQIIKSYLEPHIAISFYIYQKEQRAVLVIPPNNLEPPYVIKRDGVSIKDGDIYVRRGSTITKAKHYDFTRFIKKYIRDIDYKLNNLEEKVHPLLNEYLNANGATNLVVRSSKQYKNKVKSRGKKKNKGNSARSKTPTYKTQHTGDQTLEQLIGEVVDKNRDPLLIKLLKEARKISLFLTSDSMPWALQDFNNDELVEINKKLEEISTTIWTSLAKLVLYDNENKYDDVIITTLSGLAQEINPPTGKPVNEAILNMRYLPLVVSLYIVSVGAVYRKNSSLLNKLMQLKLRSHYNQKDFPVACCGWSLIPRRRRGIIKECQSTLTKATTKPCYFTT